jgi:hypothetical protein
MELNYPRESRSIEEDASENRELLNREFFITDPKTGDLKEGEMHIIRFYNIDNYMKTVVYAVQQERTNDWMCYNAQGYKLMEDLDSIRRRFKDKLNIFEEPAMRRVRYFRNQSTFQEERVYYHPRSKATPSASAKLDRADTRDVEATVHDGVGEAMTVESRGKVRTCKRALDFIWEIPGIETDYFDGFSKSSEHNLNLLSAGKDLLMLKYRVLRPIKCEVIIDILSEFLDKEHALDIKNHRLYRYRQNMVGGVFKRQLLGIDFTAERIREWIEYKIRHFEPLAHREDLILDRYGNSSGHEKIREIRQKAVDLHYQLIINALKKD